MTISIKIKKGLVKANIILGFIFAALFVLTCTLWSICSMLYYYSVLSELSDYSIKEFILNYITLNIFYLIMSHTFVSCAMFYKSTYRCITRYIIRYKYINYIMIYSTLGTYCSPLLRFLLGPKIARTETEKWHGNSDMLFSMVPLLNIYLYRIVLRRHDLDLKGKSAVWLYLTGRLAYTLIVCMNESGRKYLKWD